MVERGAPAGAAGAPEAMDVESLVESVPVGLGIWGADLRCVRVNAHLAAINGLAANAHVGLTPTELLGPLGATVEAALRKVLETGQPVVDADVRGHISARPHEERVWRVTYFPLAGAEGLGALVVDVTDRVADDARLRASEERFRLLVEGVADYAIYTLDPDGQVASWNAGAARIHGYPSSDIVGSPFSRFFPEEAVAAGEPARLLAQARQEGRAESEGWRVRADGTRFWAGAVLTSLREADGGLRGYSKVVRDLSQQRAAHEALRMSEMMLRNVLQSAPDAIFVVDGTGQIRDLNLRAEQMFGYSAQELAGQPVEILVPQRLRDVHQRYRDGYLHAPSTRPMGGSLDLTARRKDGSEFPVEVGLGATPSDDDRGPLVTVVVTDITERQQAQQQLAQRATHDGLTGLPNRALFLDRLGQVLRGLHRPQDSARSTAAVLFLDLDRFKLVNDSLGHSSGDDLLIQVAFRLQEVLRPGDTVARLGGDEFAMLCEGLRGEREALAIGRRIVDRLSQPFQLAHRELVVTSSVGVVLAADADVAPENLLRDADAAMYRAKERGKARVELFDARVRADSVARLELESDLRRAVEAAELTIDYQPIVSLADGRIVGVEALARWTRNGRNVPPEVFLDAAEETGLIVPLGAQVLDEACVQAARWARHTPDGRALPVSVNLSVRQLAQPDLLATVRRSLARAGIEGDRLSLELAEGAVMREAAGGVAVVRGLRELGVRVALDGFGTGYSSLSRLRELSVTALKIDRSFVAGMNATPGNTAIVAAIVSLARAYGVASVGVGVESAAQAHTLRELGCHHGQGFHYGRPQPAAQLEEMLLRQVLDPQGD